MTNLLREVILNAYLAARTGCGPSWTGCGKTDDQAAQAAWEAVRAHPSGRKLRAPNWGEALDHNGGGRRTYKVPLGVAWAVANGRTGDRWRGLASHAANWARTKLSEREMAFACTVLIDILEVEAEAKLRGPFFPDPERDPWTLDEVGAVKDAWNNRPPRVWLSAVQRLERMKADAEARETGA